MCQSTKTAIDILKSQKRKKTITKEEIIMVFEQVVKDSSANAEKVAQIEKDMSLVKTDIAVVKNDLTEIKDILKSKNKSVWDRVPLLKEIPALAWLLLIVIVGTIGAVLGANMEWIGGVIK